MFADLLIVIVNWNLKQDTLDCIASLLKSGASITQIVVVDNGSTDGSIAAFRNIYKDDINIIDAKANLGYAAGANRGINYGLNHDARWILLLNNDTTVADNFVGALKNAALTHSDYGIIGPVILYQNRPSIISSLGDRFIGNSLLTIHYYKDRKLTPDLPKVIPIDVVNGCAMMVHRSVFHRIGILDASLFMYGEEVDFCWRAKSAGFKFAAYPDAKVWHKISKSSGDHHSFPKYLSTRNQVTLYKRYARNPQLMFLFIYTFLRVLGLSVSYLFTGQLGLILPMVRGWLEGWFVHRFNDKNDGNYSM
jgi:GT2 family glycosyltransferase